MYKKVVLWVTPSSSDWGGRVVPPLPVPGGGEGVPTSSLGWGCPFPVWGGGILILWGGGVPLFSDVATPPPPPKEPENKLETLPDGNNIHIKSNM